MATGKRVRDGARLLDEVKPSWRTRVDWNQVENPEDILILVFGSKQGALRELGLEDWHDQRNNGFAIATKKHTEHYERERASLMERWKKVVEGQATA